MSRKLKENHKVTEGDLHAFIDGELPADRARAVEAAILADPVLAATVAAYRADKDFMKRLYGPLINRPVPPHLVELARSGGATTAAAPVRAAGGWRLYGSIAAMLAVVVTGGALLMRAPTDGDVVRAALAARTQQVALADDMGRYNDALSRIVDVRVKVPDLSRAGYHLTGVALLDDAATIAYRDGQGRLFTIYLRGSDGKVRFDQFKQADLRICVWQDDRLSMVMAGEMSAAIMQKLASMAYLGLTA